MNLHALIYKRLHLRSDLYRPSGGGGDNSGVDREVPMDVTCLYERVWVANSHASIYGRPVV